MASGDNFITRIIGQSKNLLNKTNSFVIPVDNTRVMNSDGMTIDQRIQIQEKLQKAKEARATRMRYLDEYQRLRNQPQLSTQTTEERAFSNRMKAEKETNKFLSKNQHLWDWTTPFMNTSSTNIDNAQQRFDFNANTRNSMITTGSFLASPFPTTIGLITSSIGNNIGGNIGEYLGSRETGETIGGFLGGIKGFKYANNVGRRAVETGMRTGLTATPRVAINNLNNMIKYDKKRVFHIGNYILTGFKFGPKGYYNSFADTPTSYYSGFNNNIPEANDLVDAFLYKKIIDPRYGVKLIDKGRNFGPHTNYVYKKFFSKADQIPIYEIIQDSPKIIKEGKLSPYKGMEETGSYWQSSNGIYPDVGGHLYQTLTLPDYQKYYRGQDIWKFDPEDWKNKWSFQSNPEHILRIVDKYGTPIITKTKWQNL